LMGFALATGRVCTRHLLRWHVAMGWAVPRLKSWALLGRR
jgi:hypothetical protein